MSMNILGKAGLMAGRLADLTEAAGEWLERAADKCTWPVIIITALLLTAHALVAIVRGLL